MYDKDENILTSAYDLKPIANKLQKYSRNIKIYLERWKKNTLCHRLSKVNKTVT